MSGLKVRLMSLSIKGELLSSGRILRTWPLWKLLHWGMFSLLRLLLNADEWEFYRKLRLGILRKLIVTLETMNGEEARSIPHLCEQPLDPGPG